MRILTVVPVMGIGGAEVVAAVLVRAQQDAGHDAVLASGGGFRADALVAHGVTHVPVPLGSRRPLDLVRSVLALRRTARPDVVHAHNVKAAVVARLGVGRRVPVVATVHGVPDGSWPRAARLLRRVADRVVAVSPHVRDRLVEHGVPTSRIHLVENTVAPPPVVERSEARRRLGLDADAPVVLCLARLVPQKRHDLLVDAWASMAPRTGPATLLVAGDGPTRPAVEARVADRCGDADVRLLGARDDVGTLLGAADVLVLPTDWEGLPISLLEAMGAGVPVVVSAVGGVVETLGSAVRLVEPGSAPALASALQELLADPAARHDLADRGRALVDARYSPQRMVRGHEQVTRDLVGPDQEVPR